MSGTVSCCTPSVVTDVNVCPPLCEYATLNCNDFISISIQAILDLAQTNGSDAQEIFNRALLLCPTQVITQTDIDNALTLGARRGVFHRIVSAIGAIPTFMVNARMALFNYTNRIYNRPPCFRGSFWRCNP